METLKNFFNGFIDWVATTGVNTFVKILISLVVMFIAFKIINKIARTLEKKGDKPNHDKTLMRTLAYVVRISAKCIVTICIIGFLGFDTSALTALVASLGVCVGLAVNGAVANLAGGVLIILTRPFKVDDFIEAQGHSGTVEAIHMTNTRIITPDNKVIYLPNGALANGNIINYSENDTRRVDFKFSISYDADFEKAKAVIKEVCEAHELVLKDQDVMVRVTAHSSSSIDIAARVWVKKDDYWTVNFDLLESVKAALDKEGIEIPYNQLDVRVKNA